MKKTNKWYISFPYRLTFSGHYMFFVLFVGLFVYIQKKLKMEIEERDEEIQKLCDEKVYIL